MRRVYLDHAATTPTDPAVLEAMLPYLREHFANPSSVHGAAQQPREAVETARRAVARLIGARSEEIVFTSGGTESNNTALLGLCHALRGRGDHVVTSAVEHKSVLRACEHLESLGIKVTRLPVDRLGRVDPDAVGRALTPRTLIVSVMHANNEIGTLQPVAEIGKIARARKVRLHVDAVQTAGHLPLDVEALGADLLSLSAHKLAGPKGVGALFVRRGVPLTPLLHGGDQEEGRRASTLNVPGIVGLGRAAELALERGAALAERLAGLQRRLIAAVAERIPGVRLNGHPELRLPGNVHLGFEDADGELLLSHLDQQGICCATGSACDASRHGPSHVLEAIGLPRETGSLRFSLGWTTDEADLDRLLEVLPGVVKKVRALSEFLE